MPADVVIAPYTSRIKITHHRRIEADLEREEQLHEKYAPLQKYWSDPFLFATPQKPRRKTGGAFQYSHLPSSRCQATQHKYSDIQLQRTSAIALRSAHRHIAVSHPKREKSAHQSRSPRRKQLCQQPCRCLVYAHLRRRDPLVQRREQQHTLLARNGRLHDRYRPLQQMLRLCTYPAAQLPIVARREHKIQTKLRIRIGDGDLLTQMILLIPFLIGTVSDGLHPLCIKVITLQRQYTRVQPPVRHKQHLRIFTDLLDTTSRKACCRIICQNWNRVELRYIRRSSAAQIPS